MNSQLLFEIGTEEIPAQYAQALSNQLRDLIAEALSQKAIFFGTIHAYNSPRRIAIIVDNIADELPASSTTRLGPKISAAFNKDGTPSLACLGFAKSCGVTAADLLVIEEKNDKRVGCNINIPSTPTVALIPELLQQALYDLKIPRPMRWGHGHHSFIRPVHWLLCLFNNTPLTLEAFGVKSGEHTYGHRFLHPEAIEIPHPSDYVERLATIGKVMVDFDVRQQKIRDAVKQAARQISGTAIIPLPLLHEVTALVEWPVVHTGTFHSDFLTVPAPALMTSMQYHQKVFPVENQKQQLMPYFIFVANIESKNPPLVIRGNERVMHARLSDAQFFYQNDIKKPLSFYTEKLKTIVFQKSLGTLSDRTERLMQLNSAIAAQLNLDTQQATRAAELAKFDLMTEMVGEFPELQGIMGYYYALAAKESPEIAAAIREHYQPRFSKDDLAESMQGNILALSDRLDVLVGILGINKHPSGDKDPYGLRRMALAVVRILIQKALPLDLYALLQLAASGYSDTLANNNVVDDTYQFIIERMKYWYLEQGFSAEVFQSVKAGGVHQLIDFDQRIQAVKQFTTLPEANALSQANKRLNNLLKKSQGQSDKPLSNELLESGIEKELVELMERTGRRVMTCYQQKDYTQALFLLATLKDPIDSFFETVHIMVEDDNLRENRLTLIAQLQQLLTQVADISELP